MNEYRNERPLFDGETNRFRADDHHKTATAHIYIKYLMIIGTVVLVIQLFKF